MRFNQFIWSIYADSERGRRAVARFSPVDIEFVESDLRSLELTVSADDGGASDDVDASFHISDLVRDIAARTAVSSLAEARTLYDRLLMEGVPCRSPDGEAVYEFGHEMDEWYDYVAAVSLGLHQAHPQFFLPYGFRRRFHELEEIHRQFSIPLPPVPGKHQKDVRSTFYADMNALWQEFRTMKGLSPAEMCAFLYDFATEFITPTKPVDLPAPMKAWFVTGGSWDIEFADTASQEDVSAWGANAGIRRGDILVMYLVRPKSCIHSIWRACSDGFIDPVSHYHSTAWIGAAIRVVPLTLAELRDDPVLSQTSAVRANFQGPNGKVSLSADEYNALLDALERKGQDLGDLPRLPDSAKVLKVNLLNERDVELQLVEPFLERLGYSKKDWVRQLPVKMGRGERNYPDYAIGAVPKRGEESARMVIETKFQLSAQREFSDAFLQAKSYALRLQCQVMALAAREGLWIFTPRNGTFEIKGSVFHSWAALTHSDALHSVLGVIGRERLLGRPTHN